MANREEDPEESERDRALAGKGRELLDLDMSVAGVCPLLSSDSPKIPMHGDVMGVLITGGPFLPEDEMGMQSMPAGASIGSGAEMADEASDDEDFLENSR